MIDESAAPPSRRFWFFAMGFSSLVFVLAVARQVLPIPDLFEQTESVASLQERLAAERAALRRTLQAELSDWERRNAELAAEIEVLERGEP